MHQVACHACSGTLGPEVVYVSGRFRKNGEMNGKSGNLNNCARQIYPKVTSMHEQKQCHTHAIQGCIPNAHVTKMHA